MPQPRIPIPWRQGSGHTGPMVRGRRATSIARFVTLSILIGIASDDVSCASSRMPPPGTNPWLAFDAPSVVARSNLVLAHPNSAMTQFMPLGNGTLGAAVWAAGGFTAQLNRVDTFPDRKSPGQVTIPGLATMTGAADFKGTLDLYNAVLSESGGGMTAKIYVRADADQLVVDVTGADPSSMQTAIVTLWTGRLPQAQASGAIATLAETWIDSSGLGGSGQQFGSLAALTAGGRNVQASANGSTATVTFQPNADGSFRIICGSPSYNGSTAAATVASQLFGSDATKAALDSAHTAWWHRYWSRVALIKATSTDNSAEYVENLRAIYLYITAAQSRGELPGSQAGVADLFSFDQDSHQWFPAGYWFWNLRMQVAANMSAGAFDMNVPIFNLYTSNLTNMQAWTQARMGARPGICLPETMRFNGNGYYSYPDNQSCDQTITPTYNSLTITSGAEVALWIWQQFQMTGDQTFLQTNYPIMSNAAQFLLAYATVGTDGLLHTTANAHETQWSVTDPITDVAAMRALFPAVVSAAQRLGTDASLVAQLQAAIPMLPPLPRTDIGRTQVLAPSDDSAGTDIFAYSTQPTATIHNDENLDLEPVWPYNVVTDTGTEFAIAQRTYAARATKDNPDWSFDAIDAARLGLASEVSSRLAAGISKFQRYPCGLAAWDPSTLQEPYVEQIGILTAAVNEAIAQDFDGLLRLAPAWPTAWELTGTVFIQGSSKVHVQYQSGMLAYAVLDTAAAGAMTIRNPWPGSQATVIDSGGATVVPATADATFSISVQPAHSYLIKRSRDPTPSRLQVTGSAAATVKSYGSQTLGVR
jgi:hypothetical protein